MLQAIKIDPGFDFIGRAATRSVISQINFRLLATAQNIVRERIRKDQEENQYVGADAATQPMSEAEESIRAEGYKDEEKLRQKEMALAGADEMTPIEIARLLSVIRSELVFNLHTGKGVISLMYDGPEPITASLQRQMDRKVTELTTEQRKRAEALNYPVEKALESAKRSQHNIASWLLRNKEDILHEAGGIEGVSLGLSAEQAWDKLPVMVRLQLYSAADNGLVFARDRETESAVLRGRRVGEANAWLIENHRILLQKEVEKLMKEPKVAQELRDLEMRGFTTPKFAPMLTKKAA